MSENIENGSIWLPLEVEWRPFACRAKKDASIVSEALVGKEETGHRYLRAVYSCKSGVEAPSISP